MKFKADQIFYSDLDSEKLRGPGINTINNLTHKGKCFEWSVLSLSS